MKIVLNAGDVFLVSTHIGRKPEVYAVLPVGVGNLRMCSIGAPHWMRGTVMEGVVRVIFKI